LQIYLTPKSCNIILESKKIFGLSKLLILPFFSVNLTTERIFMFQKVTKKSLTDFQDFFEDFAKKSILWELFPDQ